MTVSLVLIVLLMAGFAGWLIGQSIRVRPWVADTGATPPAPQTPPFVTAPRVGLAVFLAVVTSLFALAVSAFLMRRHIGADWQAVPVPALLWWNTGLLIAASVALQLAWRSTRQGRQAALRRRLALGGGLTLAFVIGQALAWQRLEAAGHPPAANPANAFFYLLTALHALHLLGGLVAWGRVLALAGRGISQPRLRQAVELCALYWHFLLLVWGGLFGVLLMS
ncbi:cytochrome c oxidase subunit 3 [Halomonas beimenensis]|uniref:Cytochrome c oxidase subunit III n=1 Tax=Halomonas beimenensis TaxID=475662 RepID=A0A291P7U2_9GAMM|nr:cytochrome c oxidase subunit 3 [Halomonas beimenensis]ATJ82932.1 cytochrome c oxidase subunit III [Halomonas beimenensis]